MLTKKTFHDIIIQTDAPGERLGFLSDSHLIRDSVAAATLAAPEVGLLQIEKAFENTLARRALVDYNQFDTTFLTSQRGGGKTFLTQDLRLLSRFFKSGQRFIYIRESQVEIDYALRGGFWDANLINFPHYNRHNFSVRGNKILIDDRVAGIALALSTYCNVRGSGFMFGAQKTRPTNSEIESVEEVQSFAATFANEVFFDEFEPLKPKIKSAERFRAFLHVCETFFRFRKGVHATLCGNLEKAESPFLSYFNFPDLKNLSYGLKKSYTAPDETGKRRPLAVWVHIPANEEWLKMRSESYVGKISQESEMFVSGGVVKGADYTPTQTGTRRSVLYNLIGEDVNLTYWTDRKGTFYISTRSKNKTFQTFTFDLRHCTPSVRILPEPYKKQLLNAFEGGKICFDSSKAYDDFINLIPNRRK